MQIHFEYVAVFVNRLAALIGLLSSSLTGLPQTGHGGPLVNNELFMEGHNFREDLQSVP